VIDRHNISILLDIMTQVTVNKNEESAGTALFFLIPETVKCNIALILSGTGHAAKFTQS